MRNLINFSVLLFQIRETEGEFCNKIFLNIYSVKLTNVNFKKSVLYNLAFSHFRGNSLLLNDLSL